MDARPFDRLRVSGGGRFANRPYECVGEGLDPHLNPLPGQERKEEGGRDDG